jgi:flagellar biosynthetic protein FlhB
MASGSAGDKTEKATPKKRAEARKEGQVARSMEINSALAMLASFVLLSMWGPRVWRELSDQMVHTFEHLNQKEFTVNTVMDLFMDVVVVFAKTAGPFMIGLAVVGVLASVIQVRPKISPAAIKPKFSKINPISGFKQKFGPASLVDLAKNILKIFVVGVPAATTLWNRKDELLSLGDVEPQVAGQVAVSLIISIGLKVAAVYMVIAVADYIWQKHRFEKQLRMSKSEVKQEARQQEIAPEMKAQQRRRQRDMARRRMLDDVPNADVIITNPTHYAIALRYDPEAGAPVVLAKGADLLAKRIRDVGDEHGIMRVENKPLARELYARVEIGQFIPGDMFGAVAEVLAYVYRLERRQPAQRPAAPAPAGDPTNLAAA